MAGETTSLTSLARSISLKTLRPDKKISSFLWELAKRDRRGANDGGAVKNTQPRGY